MVKKIKYVSIISIITLLILPLISFASDEQTVWTSTIQNEVKKWFEFKYWRSDLTETEKTNIEYIMNFHREVMTTILKNNGEVKLTVAEIQAKMKAEQEKFINLLLPYVASDQVEKFKADMAPRIPWNPVNKNEGNNWEKYNGTWAVQNDRNNLPKNPNQVPQIEVKKWPDSKYWRANLTEADKANIEKIMKTHWEIMTALLKNNGEVKLTGDEIQAKMQAEQESFIKLLLPYVASDQVEKFKADMAPRMPWNPVNKNEGNNWEKYNGTWAVQNDRNNLPKNPIQIVKQNQILPASVGSTIDKKLATFSSTDDKITWLKWVSSKIDTLLTTVSAPKTKILLIALQNLIKEKIDTLNGITSDESLINDLLK